MVLRGIVSPRWAGRYDSTSALAARGLVKNVCAGRSKDLHRPCRMTKGRTHHQVNLAAALDSLTRLLGPRRRRGPPCFEILRLAGGRRVCSSSNADALHFGEPGQALER